MLCQEIMKRDVKVMREDDTILASAKMMKEGNTGFLPVCSEDRKVLGTITDRDIAIRVVADDKPSSTRVADVMSKDVISCKPGDDIKEAERLMQEHRKSRIVCVENDTLAGVISLSDIVDKEDDVQAAKTMRKVSERELRPS